MNDKEKIIKEYWNQFLENTGRDKNLRYINAFSFGANEIIANELASLVLSGKKKATSSSFLCYQVEEEPIPAVGNLSIVTDWDKNPICVIEVTAVNIIPFKDITYDICKREGEDENLESWRENHIKFFTLDAREAGFEFTWDMLVVFEDFKVVYK